MNESDEFAAELQRTVDRLKSLPLNRLERPDADGRTPADLAFELSQVIVLRTAALRDEPAPELPLLAPQASGAQLAVVGKEFGEVASASPAELDRMSLLLRELRRRI